MDRSEKYNYTYSLANQMKHRDREMVPRFLVVSMFGLMLATLVLVSWARLSERPLSGMAPDSPIMSEKTIQLLGSRNTGVSVLDEKGSEIAHSTKNKSGFIDVIWVSISRERAVNAVALNEPLRLVRRENGHVALIDDSTGWKLELIGYGQDNVAAFARLID